MTLHCHRPLLINRVLATSAALGCLFSVHSFPARAAAVTVNTMAALQDAMINAPGGQIIEIASGNYDGTIALSSNTTKSPRITLRPADRNNPPVFRDLGFNLSNWDGLILDGLSFINRNRDSSGYPSGKSLQMLKCSNVRIIDCLFSDGHEALRADNTTNFEIAYCTFRRCGMDNIRVFAGQKNLWIHHVKIHDRNIDESRLSDPRRHPDGIQFATNGTNLPIHGVLIEDCWIENLQTKQSNSHSVFFGNNAVRPVANGGLGKSLAESGSEDVTVRRNYFYQDNIQGLFFEGMTNGLAEQNLMRTGATTPQKMPTIWLAGDKFVNIDLVNNVTARTFLMSNAPPSQVSQIDNQVSTTLVPTGWAFTDVGLTLANPKAPRVGQYAARNAPPGGR